MAKILNVNGAAVLYPSNHGCGYAYEGGCACNCQEGYAQVARGDSRAGRDMRDA